MDTIVIGGGAAGMMAAVAAAQGGSRVTILEKNEKLGKKLFLTGKGRCNVTNAGETEALLAHVCTNEKFLYSAFYQLDNRAVMRLVEEGGCPLKIERGERVFPVSDHSSDVIGAFVKILKALGVEIRLRTEVRELLLGGGKASADDGSAGAEDRTEDRGKRRVCGVRLSNGRTLMADRVIVCTGGLSYPSTGSTGDGYRFAEQVGHRVTECRPALVPLETAEEWCGELMGLSLRNVGLRMICEQRGKRRTAYEGFGEMLFTHFGVSGPLVLTASSFLRGSEAAELSIDLKPALSEEQLDRRLLRDFEEQRNKQFRNALNGLFPVRLIPIMLRLSGVDPEKRVCEITRQERAQFLRLIKNLPLHVAGTRSYAEAIITQGGVSVKEVDPSTMESKLAENLYFAGELLDLDAQTGGYNLQIAWSTGYLAGMSAARSNRGNRTSHGREGETYTEKIGG